MVCLLWKSDKFSHFAVLSFVLLINTICYTLTLVIHIFSKQRILKDPCTWCSFSAANTDSVVPIVLVFPLFCPSTLCEVKSAQLIMVMWLNFLNQLKQSGNHKRKRWSYVTLKWFSNTHSCTIIWCKLYQVVCIAVLTLELIIYIPAEYENKVDIHV
jgi:hypothetical protein